MRVIEMQQFFLFFIFWCLPYLKLGHDEIISYAQYMSPSGTLTSAHLPKANNEDMAH